jgi:short-subunit dehydrogenase
MPKRTAVALSGAVVVVTGASRGLGPILAEALARRGAQLVLAARNGIELEDVAERLRALGGRVLTVPTDVADRAQLAQLVARANAEFGRIDVLVNNAALEQVSFFEQLSEAETDKFIMVNLTAPVQLTRLVLPGMLERGSGHVVNIASIAGFGAAAFGETYGATKAGLIGFTRSLRASLQTLGSPVSASVICPGFISDAGMYADLQAAHAVRAPGILGTCTPQAVADSMLRAIERDLPESLVSRRPLRLMLAVGVLFPRLLERLTLRLGVNTMFLQAVQSKLTDEQAERSKAHTQ